VYALRLLLDAEEQADLRHVPVLQAEGPEPEHEVPGEGVTIRVETEGEAAEVLVATIGGGIAVLAYRILKGIAHRATLRSWEKEGGRLADFLSWASAESRVV